MFFFFSSEPGPLREVAEQISLVWDLVVALWGRLKEDGDDEEDLRAAEDRETYQSRIARKAALSNWLAEAAQERISQEVDSANFQVFSTLSDCVHVALANTKHAPSRSFHSQETARYGRRSGKTIGENYY